MKKSHATIALSLCLTAIAPASRAQPPPKPETAEVEALTDKARQLFMDGLDALKRGRWAEAHASLLAAWRIKPHYQIASNLGASELKLGKHREAAEHLSYYLREAPPAKEKERERAKAMLDEALARVAAVTVVGPPAGAELRVDGTSAGSMPLAGPLFMDPGEHVLEARAEGFWTGREKLDAKAGEKREVRLALRKDEPAPAPTVPPKPPERRSLLPGIVLGGAAVAGLAVGAGLLGVSGSKSATASDLNAGVLASHHSCIATAANFDARCADIADVASTSDRLHNAGVGVLVGGSVLAAASVIYFVWPAPRVSVVPVAGKTGGGVWASGSF
jgi:hypothetical protein